MTISWPPYGRWAAAYKSIADEKALNWVPKSQISGKVGYAVTPLGRPELGVGFDLSVSSTSKNKEAAYLFIQWMNSKKTSLERVQLPFTLRDPFRMSHYASKEYAALWPDAPAYLATIKESGTGCRLCGGHFFALEATLHSADDCPWLEAVASPRHRGRPDHVAMSALRADYVAKR